MIHTDKKPQGSPNALAASSDQLDQSQDSDDRKDAGYNLRSMFKDVHPPSENSNGTAVNVGKRRKSLTIFGLRRGSDPVGMKIPEGTGRETGGVRFGIQQQPVVLEEPLLTKSIKDTPESGTKAGPTPETETTKTQTDKQTSDSSSVPKDGSKHEPTPEPYTGLTVNPSDGSTGASAPRSLPIPSSASSEQTFKRTEKQADVEYDMLRNNDPGPLQTSTPIAPGPGYIPCFTPVTSSGQPEPSLDKGLPLTQTPPDLSSSPDQEVALGASLDLTSIGSSPLSSIPIKTASSVSSLKTPTSPFALTPSPKPSPRNTPSEAATTAFSPTLTQSPKLPSGRAITGSLQARTPSPALSPSPKLSTKGDMVSSPLSVKEQEPEEARIPTSEEMTEIKLRGILKKGKMSPPAGDSKGSPISSPSDQLSKNKLSSLPVSPSSPMPPSSPLGNRISSVAIVKASPDSKREFSVVTMVEKEEQSTSQQSQAEATSEFGVGSGKEGAGPLSQGEHVPISGVGQPAIQIEETSGAEVRSMVSQEKDDMVEMEDIRDCKVTQVEEAERLEEESQKTVNIQSKPD